MASMSAPADPRRLPSANGEIGGQLPRSFFEKVKGRWELRDISYSSRIEDSFGVGMLLLTQRFIVDDWRSGHGNTSR